MKLNQDQFERLNIGDIIDCGIGPVEVTRRVKLNSKETGFNCVRADGSRCGAYFNGGRDGWGSSSHRHFISAQLIASK